MIDDELIELVAHDHWFYGAGPLSYYHLASPFVYYIQSGPVVKIGSSTNPEKRVDQIRRGGKAMPPSMGLTEDPRLIAYMPGDARAEKVMHRRFAHLRDQGEWFHLAHELASHIYAEQERQARLEVDAHIAHYVKSVKSHGWPEAEWDAEEHVRDQIARKEVLNLAHLEEAA